MRAPTSWYAIGLAAFGAVVLASPTPAPTPTANALWQPQRHQMVLDLEVVYGDDVESLFKSWNTDVLNINHIFPESTYTVSYVTPLPPAASSASVSWSSISDASSTMAMLLRFPEKQRADSGKTNPTATTSAATTRTPKPTSTPTPTSTLSATATSSGAKGTSPNTATTASVPSGTEATTPTTATPVSSGTKVTTTTAATTTLASNKKPTTGRLADVCEACSFSDVRPSVPKFRCFCDGSIVSGDLGDLLVNTNGILLPFPNGHFDKSCSEISIDQPFLVQAICRPSSDDKHKASIDLGSRIKVVSGKKGGRRQFAVIQN